MAPSRTTRPFTRLLARAVLPAALGLAVMLPAGATARQSGPHVKAAAHACGPATKAAVRRSHHGSGHSCVKRHAHKHATHKPKKTVHKTTPPAVELLPAACEDGTLPGRSSGGAYTCEDGSAPSCEEGTLVHAAGAAPMCAVKASPGEQQCSPEGGECASEEFACGDSAGGEASRGCERAGEAEAPEAEEE